MAIALKESENKETREVIIMAEKKVLSELLSDQEKIIQEFSSGGFLVNANELEIQLLMSDKRVESVEEIIYFRTSVQDVVEITNATTMWQQQVESVNLTGADQTVCSIDTGIDFSHSDLIGKSVISCNLNCINQICVEDCNVTDLHGHGTHMAGIVAAQGGISGIGLETKVIGLKVFPGSGNTGATTTGVVNAIDWCVDNTEAYNISVILLGLGTSFLYSDACDALIPSLSNSIENAFMKNISVIAPTGNAVAGDIGNTTAIAAPACIQKVIAVAATNKDDSIAGYGHYNDDVRLFAPGTTINATCVPSDNPDGYCAKSGTSMSAAVVAGAVAIINQGLKVTGQTMTPLEIESLLEEEGDTATNGAQDFSRVNVFNSVSAILEYLPHFTRGDVNNDGVINIADPISIQNFLFNGQTISCYDAADTNDDGVVNIADSIYLLEYLFSNGPQVPHPFSSEGVDPTADVLECNL